MGKKKIVFLSRYQTTVFRGVESHVFELSKRLKNKFEVDIFSGKDADSLVRVLKGNYDFVIPTNGRLQALKVSLGRFLSGYKTIIAGHAGIGRDDIWNLAVSAPNLFIALTDYQQSWAKRWGWRSKIVKIPNGVDLVKFSPNGKKAELSLKQPIILSVGALEWYKYHDLTIKAVSKLTKGSLLIVGKGSLKEDLLKLGKDLLGEKRFKLLEVNYSQMPEIYRSTKLFVLPSWDREAFGIVYLEAMASNLPVIATSDEARKEIVGEAGYLIDPLNQEAFVQALQKALVLDWQDKPRTQAEKFSWDKIALQYEKLFMGRI